MDSASTFRLHLGGTQAKPGWKILNIQPGEGVDYVGDIQDLAQFLDDSCDELYASHVLEHVPHGRILSTLRGFHRILKPGGRAMISVPDLEVLCRLFNHPQMQKPARFHVMTMMFGGQVNATDFHFVGLTFEFLCDYLGGAGFTRVERVASFGLFDDISTFAPYGVPISLNLIAYKSAAPVAAGN